MSGKRVRKVLAVVLVLVFIASAAGFAADHAEEQMVVPDLLIGKPLGLLALGLGGLTYVVTLPVTIPCGWHKKAKESLVKKPYRFTFQRGLGEDLTGVR